MLAILCSDLHFSHRPPIARSYENWYTAQDRQLEQLFTLVSEHRCSLVVAGDILHRWNEPAQLVNFLLKRMPNCCGINGQHDTPNHAQEDLHRSAFWTLVEAGKVTYLQPDKPLTLNKLILHGFPWGHPVTPWTGGSVDPFGFRLAVCHEMVWTSKTGYPGAPERGRLAEFRKRLKGYDACVVGDNHCGLLSSGEGKTPVFVPGCFQRRTSAERDSKPCVGLLYSDGRIERHYLDVSKDQFIEPDRMQALTAAGMEDFLEELGNLSDVAVDFGEALRRALDGAPAEVRRTVLGILDRGDGK